MVFVPFNHICKVKHFFPHRVKRCGCLESVNQLGRYLFIWAEFPDTQHAVFSVLCCSGLYRCDLGGRGGGRKKEKLCVHVCVRTKSEWCWIWCEYSQRVLQECEKTCAIEGEISFILAFIALQNGKDSQCVCVCVIIETVSLLYVCFVHNNDNYNNNNIKKKNLFVSVLLPLQYWFLRLHLTNGLILLCHSFVWIM